MIPEFAVYVLTAGMFAVAMIPIAYIIKKVVDLMKKDDEEDKE